MSLINQMLKDLEQRGARPNEPREAISPALIADSSRRKPLPAIRIAGLIIAIIAGIYLWQQKVITFNDFHKSAAVDASNPTLPQSTGNVTDNTSEPAKVITPASAELPAAEQENNINEAIAPHPQFESKLIFAPKIETATKEDQSHQDVIEKKPAATQHKNILTPAESSAPVAYVRTAASNNGSPIKKPVTEDSLQNKKETQTAVVKQIRPEQRSDNHYKHALSNLQQGRVAKAQSDLMQALEIDPANHEARQTLVSLLIENKRLEDAKLILSNGLKIAPEQNNFRMALARLLIEANNEAEAFNTLEQGLAYAKNDADFQSFIATLYQRMERHEDAVSHYMTSLSINPVPSSTTLIGLGISLQKTNRLEDARQVYTRAKNSASLSPVLSQFIEQQLKQINQSVDAR